MTWWVILILMPIVAATYVAILNFVKWEEKQKRTLKPPIPGTWHANSHEIENPYVRHKHYGLATCLNGGVRAPGTNRFFCDILSRDGNIYTVDAKEIKVRIKAVGRRM